MTPSIKISRAVVNPLLSLAFPEYTGRRCALRISESYSIADYQLCWDGGNRTEVRCVVLDGAAPRVVELSAEVPWSGNSYSGKIPANAVVVELHTMGRDKSVTFHVAPGSAFLPALQPGAVAALPPHAKELAA